MRDTRIMFSVLVPVFAEGVKGKEGKGKNSPSS